MATQAASTEQLLIKLDSDLMARLKDSAARFGDKSGDQIGAEIIERYLEAWIASKETESANGAEPRASASGETAHYNEVAAAVSQNNGQENVAGWNKLQEQWLAQMMADPGLTDAEKQELLRQAELPDDEWEPTVLPEGAEPLSVTIIKMRRGE